MFIIWNGTKKDPPFGGGSLFRFFKFLLHATSTSV